MDRLKKKHNFFLILLVLIIPILISSVKADWIISREWTISDDWTYNPQNPPVPDPPFPSGVNLLLDNNSTFNFASGFNIASGGDFNFRTVQVNSSQIRIDKSYTTNYRTRFYIWVASTNNSRISVNSFFPTVNTTAQFTLTNPTAIDVTVGFHCPEALSTITVTGAKSQTYYAENDTSIFVVNTVVSTSFIISLTYGEYFENYRPVNYDFDITDVTGDENWVFSETQYYSFQCVIQDLNGYSTIDTVSIGFTDGLTQVNASYDTSTEIFTLINGSSVVNLRDGTVAAQGSNRLAVTFEFYFEKLILDAYDVDVWMFCNDSLGAQDGWEIRKADYFNIYNLGGRALIESTGSAGRLAGGDVFDLYAHNGSSVTATLTFKNLQHLKLLPMLEFDNGGSGDDGVIRLWYNMSYYAHGEWIEGWTMLISQPFPIVGASTQEALQNIFWYQQGSYIKSEGLYTFIEATETTDCTYQVQYWLDFWINKLNASSIGAGRINAYFYPMSDESNYWFRWLTGSSWGIHENRSKENMFFETMLDENGEVLYAQEIDLMRVSFTLSVSDGLTNYAQITNHEVFDLTLGITDPFTGIQTPVFDESKMPAMPQGGFLGAVWSALTYVATVISDALGPAVLGFFDAFVGFLDSIAAWFGAPGLFTQIIAFFGSAWDWFSNSVTWILSLLGTMFLALVETMGKFTSFVGTVIGQWISMFQIFIGFLDGAYTSGINVWADLSLSTWVLLGAILYPLYLLEVAATKGVDAAINQVKFLLNVAALIVNGLISVVQLIINLISSVIEAIPVVE